MQGDLKVLIMKGGWKVALASLALLVTTIFVGAFISALPALLLTVAYRLGYIRSSFEQVALCVVALQIGGYASLMALYHAKLPERLFAVTIPWVVDKDAQLLQRERRRCAEVARQKSLEYNVESGAVGDPFKQRAMIEAAWACEYLARDLEELGEE